MESMAKRMTDTEKWEDDWFVALAPKYKLFWLFLCDRCDHAGVWKVSPSVAGALIGEPIDLEAALKAFEGRVETGDGFWWLKKFCAFQYGPVLDPANKVHKSALAILNLRGLQAPTKPLPSHYQGDKEKDKDKAKDKVIDKDSSLTISEENPEERLADAYRKTAKTMRDYFFEEYKHLNGGKTLTFVPSKQLHGLEESHIKQHGLEEMKRRADNALRDGYITNMTYLYFLNHPDDFVELRQKRVQGPKNEYEPKRGKSDVPSMISDLAKQWGAK